MLFRSLKRIETEGLATDIDELAGSDFLAEVRSSHAHYGEVLGKTKARVNPEQINFRDALRALSNAIRGYTLQVIASTDAAQPESLATARAALAPIEALRRSLASRRNEPAAPASPADPIDPADATESEG